MADGNEINGIPAAVTRVPEIRLAAPVAAVPVAAAPSPVQTALPNGFAESFARVPELKAEDFTPDELREVASAFGEVVSLVNRELRISVDESTGRVVTQILDSDTNEVVRQLPPEALLDVARRVADLVGLLINEES
mgnify:CR=1 FL=1